ncbi:MAG TPA: ASCH domain-containing protein [Gallicola sp.]|nr:ASCH domain-containing protein [Gallicola sp.]
MRVITLMQPWASLVANGYKIYEFRKMNYKYRGKILIHAGKGIDKNAMERVKELNLEYPQSQIVAEVEIEDVIECDKEFNDYINILNSIVYGNNKQRDGYAWKLKNIKKINDNQHISGKQGIWYLDTFE